jgi:enediyne biosynthesis protein E5
VSDVGVVTSTVARTSKDSPTKHPVDPRIKALRRFAVSITAFSLAGYLVLGFEQAYLTPIAGVLTAYAVSLLLEAVDARLSGRPPRFHGSVTALVNFLLPAHIAGLACSILLYGNQNLLPTIFAVTVAMASRYAIRIPVNGALRHVFNPSNFGITVTLLLFHWVAIAPPYHFTEHVSGFWDWLIPAAILVAGLTLNTSLTRRLPLIIGWVGGFVLQAVVRAVVFDHSLGSALMTMTGVAFILFTLYMITDPGTTPGAPWRQFGFGIATAAVYGALVVMHVAFGLFFALTIVCAVRMLTTLASGLRGSHA